MHVVCCLFLLLANGSHVFDGSVKFVVLDIKISFTYL